MNPQALLTKLSLRFALEAGIRLRQTNKIVEDKLKVDSIQVIEEYLENVQVLNQIYFVPTSHPYKFTIKGRKAPHIVHNIQFGLHIEENQKYNILVTKCDNGIMNLLTYEVA